MQYGLKRVLVAGTVVAGLAALVFGAVMLIQKKKAALARSPRLGQTPTLVHVATARRASLEITRDYLAIVEPFRKASLSARIISQVRAVNVDEGQLARANHPLVLLDDREIRAAIAAAKAQTAQVLAELAEIGRASCRERV
jgi:multidrug efflux pump subunit AcrA (membrane-fusion protein)